MANKPLKTIKFPGLPDIYTIESGLSDAQKESILACFRNVAWTTEEGQQLYQALYDSFYPDVRLASLSAVFTQGSRVIYPTDSLNSLKQYLVVTANYADSTSHAVTGYTLSGTLAVGTSTITVTYGGKTATFDVVVSEPKTYLVNFDFTESLVDKAGLMTPVLSHGTNATKDAQRTSAGLVFDEPEQKIYFGKINPIGKTFEFDVANFSFAGNESYHMRLLMFSNQESSGEYDAWGISPFMWRSTGLYSGYAFTGESTTSGARSWYPSGWNDLTDRNVINGKTIKIVFNSNESVSLYINDILIETKTGLYYNGDNRYYDSAQGKYYWRGCQHIQFGGVHNQQSSGDQCYNLTLSGFRVYENE